MAIIQEFVLCRIGIFGPGIEVLATLIFAPIAVSKVPKTELIGVSVLQLC